VFSRVIIFDLIRFALLFRDYSWDNSHISKGIEKRNMFIKKSGLQSYILVLLAAAITLSSGCISVKKADDTPTLLRTETATHGQLVSEVNRFARVGSMRAKMLLKFEDNSFAEFGSKEVYRQADGEVVVQRPANILLKVQVPVIGTDVAQMTSDGEKFRVAILQDGGSGKYKKFVIGTNNADYSKLQKTLDGENGGGTAKKNVNAFANLRPQHFTDAMLVRPTDDAHLYTMSTIFQIEEDPTQGKKSPLRRVNRGYYLLDEFSKSAQGGLIIARRFWFDRVGGIRLARQQIFDAKGEIESDIVYGVEGNLTSSPDYARLPLQIVVTRPQEKYSMRLTYKTPEDVTIGKTYPAAAFVLQNSWELEEVDLDKKLQESTAARPSMSTNTNTATTRFQ
jgi:outer membrane murein-binding lipoprotein Lpp